MKRASIEFIRYAIVGLISNAIGYIIYIALTLVSFEPKLAMSLMYGLIVLQTFIFNKNWTFRFGGAGTPALVRYAASYLMGYVINLTSLVILVDQAGLPHKLVQGVTILGVAALLFLAQKYWVFRPRSSSYLP